MSFDVSKVVTAGVAPIIVISACGLLALAFYNRLAAMVTRLRAFQRESLAEQEKLDRETDAAKRREKADLVRHLREQTTDVLTRARLIRASLFCLLLTIGLLTACSISLGVAVVADAAFWAAAAFFMAGMFSLIGAVVMAMLELRKALGPVHEESRFVETTFFRRVAHAEVASGAGNLAAV